MNHLSDYKLIETFASSDLEHRVNELLEQGWEIHGETHIIRYKGASVEGFPTEFWYYAQVMVLQKR